MNREQRKQKKQKAREAKAKERVLRRRKKHRAQLKAIKEDQKWARHFEVKQMPIRNDPAVTPQTEVDDPAKVEYIKKRLEHNMKILEELEKEYDMEQAAKEEAREKLEAEGAHSLKDKLDLIEKTAVEIIEEENESSSS